MIQPSNLARIALGMFLVSLLPCLAMAGPEFDLEPRKPYSLAKDVIPGFPKKPLDEDWILNCEPDSWKSIPLNEGWKSKHIPHDGFLDYYNPSAWNPSPEEERWIEEPETTKEWPPTKVPWAYCLPSFPGGAKKPGMMWYCRELALPAWDVSKERLVIRFNGAGFRLDAWLNGQPLGSHIGPYVKVDFDLSGLVNRNGSNHLVVRTAESGVSRFGGPQQFWHYQPYTGLYAPVELQVRPRIEAENLRLAPRTATQKLGFDFVPKGGAFDGSQGILSAEVTEWKSGKPAYRWTQKLDLKEGVRYAAELLMEGVKFWSPEQPSLYRFALKWNGIELCRERFGFREIRIETVEGRQHLFLNGKRLYLRMFEFNDLSRMLEPYGIASFQAADALARKTGCTNENGRLREALLAMKYANINSFRPHSIDAIIDPTFFNLCDELGFIVYLDWATQRSLKLNPQDGKEYAYLSAEAQLPLFREVVRQYHNHPSLGLFSFGNELYTFYKYYLPKGKTFPMLIGQYDEALKTEDLQKRPSSGSAGGSTLLEKSKIDLVDTHVYNGVYYGSSVTLEEQLAKARREIAATYGADLPLISSETGLVMDTRQHPENFNRWAAKLKNPDFDRKEFLDWMSKKGDPYVDWVKFCMNTGGSRCYLTDFPEWRRRAGIRMVKRYLEIYRRNHRLNDGISLNASELWLINYLIKGDMTVDKTEPWPQIAGEFPEWVLTDPIFDFREGYQPILPMVKMETPHPIAGITFKGELTVVNDSPEPVDGALTVQLRDSKGAVLVRRPSLAIRLEQGGEFKTRLEIPLPEAMPSGRYNLELFVHRGSLLISANHYELPVLSGRDRIKTLPKGKRVAVYSGEDRQVAGLLQSLGASVAAITDFASLDRYDVLIFPGNSIDVTVWNSGGKIRKWLEEGGRVLCFEQLRGKNLPWSPETMIQRRERSDFMEILRSRHPLFKGIESDMVWDNPSEPLFSGNLKLDESSLAIAAVDKDRGETANIGSLVSDVRIGKGESLVSMIDTEPYGRDGTVTRYVENALNYILGPEISPMAVPLPEGAPGNLMFLSKEDAVFVDLSKAVNRGFSGNEGWAGYGRDDMSGLPMGTTMLDSFVPFRILDPAKNNGRSCLVLRGPTRPDFPAASREIPVDEYFGALFFLQTALHVDGDGGELVRYAIHYEDGSEEVYRARKSVDLADWFNGGEVQNADVAYQKSNGRRIYLSRWENPFPHKRIQWIRMESTGEAIPILIAITGSKPDINQTK